MSNEDKMREMLKKKVWAVVGASPNPDKTSNRIYHTFQDHGYKVYPVNPNYTQMEDGTPCYSGICDLPEKPDCIDFVVPPGVTMQNLADLDPVEFPYIWLQPGTYDDDVIRYAEEKGFHVVHEGACTMASLKMGFC